MQVIPASEIKRRGIIAIQEKLAYGPVHIIKHNHLTCVVLSEEQYQELTSQKAKSKLGLVDLLSKPSTGSKTLQQLKLRLRKERNSWDKKS